MAPLKIFQKKDSGKIQKKEKAEKEPLPVKKEKALNPAGLKIFGWDIIKAPHITEKATTNEEKGKYTFKVFKNANKTKVKKAVENIFNVKTEKVRIINMPNKKRQRGGVSGWKRGYKKAIVTLQKGHKIEILSR